jgi:hypothetical protein
MSGSVSVVRQLLTAGLLDELHLLVHPIAVRTGMRLFDEAERPIPLTLLSSETFKTGVLNLVYAPDSLREGTYDDAKLRLTRQTPAARRRHRTKMNRRAVPGVQMSDREELVELMARYASIPDTGDWTELPRTVFTDPVASDFESLSGRPGMTAPRDVMMAAMAPTFAAFTATHHVVTNHRITVDGDHATIRAHVRAEHWLPSDLAGDGPACWLVVGFYDDEAVRTAEGWRLSKVKLTVTHQDNAHLLAVAQGAAARLQAS